MRINKYISSSGVCSRRKAETYIKEKRVTVNGNLLTNLAYQVKEGDLVLLDGKEIFPKENKILYLFHKPIHTLCSHESQGGKKTIYEYLPKNLGLFSVGRLDYDSEGLLLITNQGDLAQRLAHPSYEVEKEYLVYLDRELEDKHKEEMLRGLQTSYDYYTPVSILLDGKKRHGYRVILKEGKKREIRRMFGHFHYDVKRLIRLRFSHLHLGNLKAGEYRKLTKEEKDLL